MLNLLKDRELLFLLTYPFSLLVHVGLTRSRVLRQWATFIQSIFPILVLILPILVKFRSQWGIIQPLGRSGKS